MQPQVDPAYSVFEVAIIGTGGLNALGAGEAAIRTVFEVCLLMFDCFSKSHAMAS